MKTISKNGQKYLVANGEKLINGQLVSCDRLLWIGQDKQATKVEPKPECDRVLQNLLKSALR